jgi:hypothetical protein
VRFDQRVVIPSDDACEVAVVQHLQHPERA